MVQLLRQSGLLKRDDFVFEQVDKEFGHRIGKVVVSLINGIAYPIPSSKYDELVCTAGVNGISSACTP
jgi:hypothetical protein